jgi:hypothetical protein
MATMLIAYQLIMAVPLLAATKLWPMRGGYGVPCVVAAIIVV